ARSRGVMRPLLPRVVLVAHDVAVDAGTRVTREITRPLRVVEGIDPRAGECAEQDRQGDTGKCEASPTRGGCLVHGCGPRSPTSADYSPRREVRKCARAGPLPRLGQSPQLTAIVPRWEPSAKAIRNLVCCSRRGSVRPITSLPPC